MQARSTFPPSAPFRGNRIFLYAGVASAIVIVVVISVLALRQIHELADMRTALTTQNMAKLMEQSYDGQIDTIDVALQSSADEISRQLSAGNVNRHSVTDFLVRQQKRLPNVAYLRATNEHGEVIYGAGVLSSPNNNSDREYFIRLRDDLNAGLFINKPHVSRIDKKWDWLFARRISKPDGSFGGVVYAAILVDQLDKMLAQITLNTGDVATLRDAELGVIARHVFQGSNPAPPGDKKIAIPFADALAANPQEGTYVSGGTSIDAISRTQSYRRSAKYGYYVNVGISRNAALDVWQRQAWIVTGLVTIFTLVVLAFSWLISRAWQRQEKDMVALHEAQEIASLGHYSYDLRSGNWTSSGVLDGIFGIDKNFPRDALHWQGLIADDTRQELQEYINTVVDQRLQIDREYRIVRHSDGQERWVHGKGKLILDALGNPFEMVGTIQDITSSKHAEEEIRNLAFYDALTRLPNRRLLIDRFLLALAASARSNQYGAVLFLDLDKFKTLNDTLGHDYGDLLLIEVAARIKASVREVDTVARLGGDEFVVLLVNVDEHQKEASQKVAHIAEKIRGILSKPYQLKGSQQHSTSSIGVSLFRGTEVSVESLLKQADMAMYQAKDSGRNTVRFFDPLMQQAVETRAVLEAELRFAVSGRQLQLHYQIQVDNEQRPLGAEALIRWNHPTRGMVSPLQFIPIAEESSLILEIGGWVLDTACRQLNVWAQNELTRNLSLAVNVSAQQFKQHDFVEKVAAILRAHQVVPSRLKLELTESVVLNDVNDVVTKMHALKTLGVRLSMDDFGTGYSSLSYLKQLPLDQIKIDQSFVRDIATDPNDAVMVRTMIDLAKNFRLNVIAEGVETEAQLDFLKANDCMAYQGISLASRYP